MRMMPFTVSTDGSNDDDSGNKQFPIVVRTVDAFTSDVRSDVLAILATNLQAMVCHGRIALLWIVTMPM